MSNKYPGGIITSGANAGYSVAFDGTGDYLTVASSANLILGTGAFTVEAWFYVAVGNTEGVLSCIDNGSGSFGIGMYFSTTTSLRVSIQSNSVGVLNYDSTIAVGNWYHVVAVRDGSNNFAVFLNGTRTGSTTNTTNISLGAWGIGRTYANSGSSYNGYISNVRIVKGTAVYDPTQTSIRVPTQLFNITNTSLLTCNSPAIVDQSSNAFAITANGNAAASTFSPFPGYQAYNPALGASTPGIWSVSDAIQARQTRRWNMYDPYFQNTTEWHSPTSDIDIPFIRNGGRRYDKGSAAQFTAVKIDNTIFWVGTAQQGADLQVYRASAVPVAISNEGIEAALAACADITQASAVAIVSTGHSFYVLNIPGVGTYAYDVKTGLWGNWESFGQTTFRVQCGADGVYGDAINGKLWTIDPDRRTDGDDTIIYLASSFLAVPEGTYRLNGLRLNLKTGVGAPDGNPVVEFRYAETGGEDWSTWREASIGSPGNHPSVIWRQLGMIKPPGRSLEFRFSGGADFVPHEVTADLVKGSDRL